MSSARATGSGHLIWPKGTTIESVPHDFVTALDQAIRVCSWMENLPSDEMPPSWMWPLDWELKTHFDRVKEERDRKFGSSAGSDSGDLEDADNVYAARFK